MFFLLRTLSSGKLAVVQRGVRAALFQQFAVRALFDDVDAVGQKVGVPRRHAHVFGVRGNFFKYSLLFFFCFFCGRVRKT